MRSILLAVVSIAAAFFAFPARADDAPGAADRATAAATASKSRDVVPGESNLTLCKPEYPLASLEANETGTTTVEATVGADGSLTQAKVLKSSGFERLDRATVYFLSQCKFKPPYVNGQPVASTFKVEHVWKIDPDPTEASPSSAAENNADIALAASPALKCLTLTPGKGDRPEYPENLLKRKDGGAIPVELVFRAADKAPEVKVLDEDQFDDLIAAVKGFVVRYRLPCYAAGEPPVTLRQNYVFVPNDGRKVMSSGTVDVADTRRRTDIACMTHVDSKRKPEYSLYAREHGGQGKYLVSLRFDAPDRAPEVEWLADSPDYSLHLAVKSYVEGLRLPCLQDGPITVSQFFNFKLDGGSRVTLRDTTLKRFVQAAIDLPLPAYFDFATMDCPFDVRIYYMRPYKDNVVRELENSNPARKPLLDWLAKSTLGLSKNDNLKVIGDEFTLSVPCGSLNL